MTVKEWLGDTIKFDADSGQIWSIDSKTKDYIKHVADVRGYGALQKRLGTDNADKLQDEIGEFIAQAINEKLEKVE